MADPDDTTKPPRRGPGQPPYVPTSQDRELVRNLITANVIQTEICGRLSKKISRMTLRKYFAQEIAEHPDGNRWAMQGERIKAVRADPTLNVSFAQERKVKALQRDAARRQRIKADATLKAAHDANKKVTDAARRQRIKADATLKAAHDAKARVRAARRREEYPDKVNAVHHRRRARKRDAPGSFTAEDIAEIRLLQRDRCGACRKKIKGNGDIDHIIALAAGGTNHRRNLQLLCHPCNNSKQARCPIEFMQSRGFLI